MIGALDSLTSSPNDHVITTRSISRHSQQPQTATKFNATTPENGSNGLDTVMQHQDGASGCFQRPPLPVSIVVDDNADDCCFDPPTLELSDEEGRWWHPSRHRRVRSLCSDNTSDIRFIDDSGRTSPDSRRASRLPSNSTGLDSPGDRLLPPAPSTAPSYIRRHRSSGGSSPAMPDPLFDVFEHCYSSLTTLSLSDRPSIDSPRSNPLGQCRVLGGRPPSYSADTIPCGGPALFCAPPMHGVSAPLPLFGAANRPAYYRTSHVSTAVAALPLKSCLVELDPRGRRVSCSCLALHPRQLSFQPHGFHVDQSIPDILLQLQTLSNAYERGVREVALNNGNYVYYKTKAPTDVAPPGGGGQHQHPLHHQSQQHQTQPQQAPQETYREVAAMNSLGGGGGMMDGQSQYSVYMESDCRYFFQHPYARFFVAYFVIFCNFLIFAEDPVSHSHTESEIAVVGNVFAFVMTKYPPEWQWRLIKVLLWLAAIVTGMAIGKHIIHKWLLARVCRLKMFHEEQGSWMIMFLTVIVSLYVFSNVYNAVLLIAHPTACRHQITARMGITNSSLMKAAACGTWLGDFVTAWMVTDMMLQDNLYAELGPSIRAFWRKGNTRIVTFWGGALGASVVVVTLIVSDWINWDKLNRDFVATSELSRAFLASFILVMDLIIVMQDWDFPHFTSTLDINLPGMKVKAVKLNFCDCPMNIQRFWKIHITGKWFNYGIIILVMILDLNMWKNQIFYKPEEYGQYLSPDSKIYTVSEYDILVTGNRTLWTYEFRSTHKDPATNMSLLEGDMLMNSRYLAYPLQDKCTAFIPIIIGFSMFGLLVYLYGRFPPKETDDYGGRLKRRDKQNRSSSWRRERGSFHTQLLTPTAPPTQPPLISATKQHPHPQISPTTTPVHTEFSGPSLLPPQAAS